MKENNLTRQYEITIENGAHPLTCKCSTIAEAYECLMGGARLGLPFRI